MSDDPIFYRPPDALIYLGARRKDGSSELSRKLLGEEPIHNASNEGIEQRRKVQEVLTSDLARMDSFDAHVADLEIRCRAHVDSVAEGEHLGIDTRPWYARKILKAIQSTRSAIRFGNASRAAAEAAVVFVLATAAEARFTRTREGRKTRTSEADVRRQRLRDEVLELWARRPELRGRPYETADSLLAVHALAAYDDGDVWESLPRVHPEKGKGLAYPDPRNEIEMNKARDSLARKINEAMASV